MCAWLSESRERAVQRNSRAERECVRAEQCRAEQSSAVQSRVVQCSAEQRVCACVCESRERAESRALQSTECVSSEQSSAVQSRAE